MFNKKLKHEILALEAWKDSLEEDLAEAKRLLDDSRVEIQDLNEVIAAQSIIITAFAEFIINSDKKKGKKNGKKRK